ncbi:triose-phosphate isomerase [Hahella sp. CCB-MM4]|uniref:triose-phosphate isomerase n=1 Tax=Hahella sp. (strain CCB-MM4) TaxID=1926491 RepID=UPI000B9B2AD8|nr:triose-phosphate isomerase [Hahella sp. CCB-MM4]OZG73606.1 triose-phosphate isomerase [Hahella sp. CCB-MM4]
MSTANIWIGTSWKMNKTLNEALQFADGLREVDATADDRIQRFVIPPFTAAREVKKVLAGTSVKVGAQNMHWADSGAWTGEISPVMLKDCQLDIVELGHSERREHFGETDYTVGLKTEAAVRHGFIPLICVGETLEERDNGQASAVLQAQVQGALQFLDKSLVEAPLLFAYEPVWAIGDKGIPATAEYAEARHRDIGYFSQAILGRRVPCLYGGSVNPDNCEELVSCEHIDGLFIGRSAWQLEGYLEILQKCAAVI